MECGDYRHFPPPVFHAGKVLLEALTKRIIDFRPGTRADFPWMAQSWTWGCDRKAVGSDPTPLQGETYDSVNCTLLWQVLAALGSPNR